VRLRILLTVALVVVLVAVGSVSALAQKKVLRYGMAQADIGGMDPHNAPGTNDKTVIDPMFNGLVRFRPGSANPEYIEPDLAERWEVSPDGLVWTFYLRRGVQFHKGYGELTAEDVVYSLERARDPQRSAFSSDFVIFSKIEALDRYTVRITLARPVPAVQVLGVLTDYQGGMIISKKAAEEFGSNFRMNPIGTGPFQFAEYVPRQYVRLVRNEQYFRGTPEVEEIVYRFMPELRSRELAFRAGELDIIEGQREQWWVEEISKVPGTIVDVVGPGEMRTLHYNMSRPPFDDIRVRQAISYLINRDEIVEIIGPSVTVPAYSPVPPGYMAHTDDVERYDYNPQKAKQLLAEAGYPNGLHIGPVIISEVESLLVPMQIIQEQLAREGVTMDLQVVDHQTFHERIRQNMSNMVLYGAARFPTPDQYLTQFYHSASTVGKPTAVTNFSHYGSVIPGVDNLIDMARVELNQQRQVEMWQLAQKLITRDVPTLPLYVLKLVFVRKDYVDLGYEFESTISLTPQFNEKTRLLK